MNKMMMKTVREIVIEEKGSAIYNLPVIVQKFLFDRTLKLTDKVATAIDDSLRLKPGTAKLYQQEYDKELSKYAIQMNFYKEIYKEDELI